MIHLLICWQLILYYPSYTFTPVAESSFIFPDAASHQHYPAFMVCTQAQAMNLTGETLICEFAVETAPDTVMRFGGQDSWNNGPRPASARLFFSAVAGYNNSGTGSTNYWFNSQWVEIGTNTTTATLIAALDPAEWTDAGGCAECRTTTEADFWNAVANVREVGLAFGGGDFYDIGIATVSGSCTFHLTRFTVSEKFRNYRRCFTE